MLFPFKISGDFDVLHVWYASNEISEVLRGKNKKWLYDRFSTKLKDSSKKFETIVFTNFLSFIVEGIVTIFLISFFAFSGNIFYIKEIFLFMISLFCTVVYLYFIKCEDRWDFFDVFFPQMTIFQIKSCLWQNIILLEKVFEFILEYFFYSEKNFYLSKLKNVKQQIDTQLKKIPKN